MDLTDPLGEVDLSSTWNEVLMKVLGCENLDSGPQECF